MYNRSEKGKSIVINCPETDNVTILLLKHTLIRKLIVTNSIKLYCSIHNKLVDFKTGKPTKKAKEGDSVEEFKAKNSRVKMNFFLDVGKLYEDLVSAGCFKNTIFPLESLGALSIDTGNDKNPGLRYVTKTLALNVFRECCQEGVLSSLVDRNGLLRDSKECKQAFYILYARIYFHMYRVYARKLDKSKWDSIVVEAVPNFKLLRDIGYQYAKSQLEKVPPVDGAFEGIFARSLFQAYEYDQIFSQKIVYPNPVEFGFEECKGGLRPKLNLNIDENEDLEPDIILSKVDKNLIPDKFIVGNMCVCDELDTEPSVGEIQDQLFAETSTPVEGNGISMNMTAENIFNVTLGQMDGELEFNIVSDTQLHSDMSQETESDLFTFDDWVQRQ